MEEDNIIVPRWFLEVVENMLRIQYNINLDKKTGETCQDRNIKESLNGVRKLLKGEELTGGERLERLRPSLPSNLDEAANNYGRDIRLGYPRVMDETDKYICNAFKAGAKWMAEQGCTVEIDEGYFINNPQHDRRKGKFHKYYSSVFGHSKKITVTPGDKVVVQIRKK